METTKIRFDTMDAIMDVENEQLNEFQKAYFGSQFGNIMEVYLDTLNLMRNFTLVSLEEATYGKPKITYDQNLEELPGVPVSDGDHFQFDFDFYFDKDSIHFVNVKNEDKPVNMIHTYSRIEYGLNNDDIVYIKVKDITKEEYDQLMKALKDRNVPINNLETSLDEIVSEILDEIETKEKVKIVQASTIGSRGWDYDDENSDLDVRFTYVRNPRDYISLKKYSDSISYPIENGEDLLGYDLGKMIKMICTQNPFAYEIIHSSKQNVMSPYTRKIIDFSDKVFNPEKMVTIYQQVIDKKIKELESGENFDTKLVIYIIKTLGTIDYIQNNLQYPFSDLNLFFKDNPTMKGLLETSIKYKKQGIKAFEKNDKLLNLLKQYYESLKQKEIGKKELPSIEEMEEEANNLYYEGVYFFQKKEELEKMLKKEEKLDDEKRK